MDDVCMLILIILTRGTFSLETVTIVDPSLRVVSIIMNTLICITIVVQHVTLVTLDLYTSPVTFYELMNTMEWFSSL